MIRGQIEDLQRSQLAPPPSASCSVLFELRLVTRHVKKPCGSLFLTSSFLFFSTITLVFDPQGKKTEAERYFLKAIQLDPTKGNCYMHYGECPD